MNIELLTVGAAAERLGVTDRRINQLLREHSLAATRDESGAQCIPAAFLAEGAVVKGLPGVLTLLSDAGYADEEAVRWLFTADDTLPGTPIEALRDNRGTEVKRRAQALGF